MGPFHRAMSRQVSVLIVAIVAGLSSCKDPARPTSARLWQPVIPGVRVTALAVSPGGTVFAGNFDGGVLRSEDEGLEWSPSSAGWTTQPPSRVRDLWAGPDGIVVAATSIGVYVSTDDGTTWRLTTFTNRFHDTLQADAVAADSTGTVFAGLSGREGGIFRTTTVGTSWQQVFVTDDAAHFVVASLTATAAGLFLDTWYEGDYRSIDGGDTWTPFNIGATAAGYLPFTVGIVASPRGPLFAASASGIYRGNSAADAWTQVASSVCTVLGERLDGQIVAGTRPGSLYDSPDDGATWLPLGETLGVEILSLAASPNGRTYVSTLDRSNGHYLLYRSVLPTKATPAF